MERIWLKSYPEGVPETIDPDAFESLIELMEHYTERFSNNTAFSNMGTQLTYCELRDKSRNFAAFLQHLGLTKGDRVAVMLPNLLQYPIAIFGILYAGLIVVNVNPLYTARELEHQLQDSSAKAILVLANFAYVLAETLPKTAIEHVIVTEVGDLLGSIRGPIINFAVKHLKKMVPDWHIPQHVTFNKALKEGQQLSLTPVPLSNQDPAFLQYTGGTTGVAKAAVLTHRNIIANTLQCIACVKPFTKTGEDVVAGALPLYHIFSLTICCFCFLSLGSQCLLITNPRDLTLFIKIMKKIPPTIFVGLNTLFNGLLNHPDIHKANFSQLKLTIAGGMATQKSVAEHWKKTTGNAVIQGYGLTEASPVVTINPMNQTCFNESIGLPVPATDVIIRNEQNQNLGLNQLGEICVKGPQVMQAYWNKPDETEKVIDQDGWLHTGDIGKMDERGYIYLIDRKKDMILVSGFNVYPSEIEEVLAAHPQIAEVAAIGVPCEKTGEKIKVFIVKNDTADITKADIIGYCRKYLTGYKIPKIIEFRDDLPKSNVGKVLRRSLRD